MSHFLPLLDGNVLKPRKSPRQNATGHTLAIPMPGHPIPPSPASLAEQARTDVQKLENLIDKHDVVFLLMDSRESRWLPTMLGKAKNKVCI
jgi:ubiquitin-like modifier-activating enzyme ATG7